MPDYNKPQISDLPPIPVPRLPTLGGLPKNLSKKVADIRAPKHIVEARKECAYQFIEEAFLPLINIKYEFTCEEIVSRTQQFKDQYASRYNVNLGDFDLISSIDVKLEMLRIDTAIRPDLKSLINEAYNHLQHLIEICFDDFFGSE